MKFCEKQSPHSHIAYFENWMGRRGGTLFVYWYYLSISFMYFVRSGSTFATMLITVERYLVITYPLKSASWFTSGKTRIAAFCVFMIAAVLAFPRFTMYVDTNDLTDIPSLKGLKHILRSTKLNRFFYVTLKTLHSQIDFWLPFPILLIFNILSFRKVKRIAKKRKELNMSRSERKDIRATKMFLPVSIVLFLCNIEFVITYIYIVVFKIVFRELFTLLFLFVAVNSSANLIIYYLREAQFRAETRAVVWSWFPLLRKRDTNISPSCFIPISSISRKE
ncbi:unnamed protein product [Orchesella dallaii]|uniref:G-protein coupled receptors family 1 profile domain-containing protein n=1 Tax=Orchesella dallaii TaxID=48710 RepID=A0ABP1QLC4_9HEXA